MVTRDTDTARHFSELGARIFAEPEGAGLNGAIRAAANWVSESFPNDNLVVVMGDLAGVTSETLTAALSAAEQVDRGVIADQEGTGTTVLTAKSGVSLQPAYGSGSFTRHVAAGHSPIPTPAESPLRRDVDTGDDLATLARLGPGEHTRALLARIDAFPPHTSPT